ncbi:E3 ubiquitin ligase family protein [Candidatus Marinimicrobia bacterium]|nr:E3 ubiquitin ligase family protein [Candidatus Neomarinimicrobiota bacterium]|tara:strand:- start:1289 stop:2134 length:846 start_codon:yes stop_codon:yes gene_type:complete
MNCFVTCVVSSFIFPCYEVQNNFVRYSSSIGQIAKDGGLFGVLLLCAGLYMFYNSLKNLKLKRLIENVPTSKMRSVAMGLVELKGKIEVSDKVLEDPFDKKKCVFWRVHIEERVKRGKHGRWITRHKAKGQVPFFISDESGSVLIKLEGANMDDVKRDSQYETALLFSDKLPLNVRNYCNKNRIRFRGLFGGKKRMRCRVTYLEPNNNIYVLGHARPLLQKEIKNSKSVTAVIEMVNNSVFIVSDKSEKELIEDRGGQFWVVPLGIIFSGLGLGLILNVFG